MIYVAACSRIILEGGTRGRENEKGKAGEKKKQNKRRIKQMDSEIEYIRRYDDFLRKIAAQMYGGDWDLQEYRDGDCVESEYLCRDTGYYISIQKTRIDPVLNRDAHFQKCVLIEASYRIKLPEYCRNLGFWFVKCSCWWSSAVSPNLQFFTILNLP